MDKNELFDKVWGYYSDTEMSSLNVYIRWLREKLETDPKEPHYIKTVWRVGIIKWVIDFNIFAFCIC